MSKCFICNRTLKEKGQVSDQRTETETHYEHIIQNALRGKIGSSEILCKTCGGKLAEEVDASFLKFFTPVTEQLRHSLITKDHGKGNAPNAVPGRVVYSEFSHIDVAFRDGLVSSIKPVYIIDNEKRQVTILANGKIIDDYEKKVVAELRNRGLNEQDYLIKKVSDIDDGIFIPYFGNGVVDEQIALGIIKIAAEYALSCGIQREEMERVLRINSSGQGELFYDRSIITYVPQGALDSVFEFYRPLLEPEYPTHTLVLFTQEKRSGRFVLYCYVDLFSTFQQYIILSNDYPSPVFSSYYQRLLKADESIDSSAFDLPSMLRSVHQKLEKIYNAEGALDEIEENIHAGLLQLPDHLQNSLPVEFEAVDNIIMNQNMDKPDFHDMSTYDLTVAFKRHFTNPFSENCEDMAKFLSRAAMMNDPVINEQAQKYYVEKVNRLMQTIIILRELNSN